MVKDVNNFIEWLIQKRSARKETISDVDCHAVGLYAFYLADIERGVWHRGS